MRQLAKLPLLFFSIIFCTVSLNSCEKDDDDETSEDGVLRFRGFTNQDIIFYVGGEPADPSQLDMKKLLDFPEESWISYDRYRGDFYRFSGDSVDIYHSNDGDMTRYHFYFENDSLYLTHIDPWFQQEVTFYDGIGNEGELQRKHCLVYAKKKRDNGTFQSGGGFNVSDYYSIEDLPRNFTLFQDINEMGPNDTLILYNQSWLYK